MSTYENTKHKIRVNWEGSQQNQIAVKDQEAIKVIKDGQVVLLKSSNSTFNKFNKLSTEWVPMGIAWNTANAGLTERLVNWTVTTTVPEDTISLVKFEMEYRLAGSENPLKNVGIRYQTFISVEDINNNDTLKIVTWYIGWNIEYLNIAVPDFEVRLLFVAPNGNDYL